MATTTLARARSSLATVAWCRSEAEKCRAAYRHGGASSAAAALSADVAEVLVRFLPRFTRPHAKLTPPPSANTVQPAGGMQACRLRRNQPATAACARCA